MTTATAVIAASQVDIANFSASYGSTTAIDDVSLTIPASSVTAFIGPSGCGKSTLLRSINRLHETLPDTSSTGSIRLGGTDVYGTGIDPVVVRQRIGMVFQRPNPFPAMSIQENVLSGVRLRHHRLSKATAEMLAEWALRSADLWGEVKDRLGKPGGGLSGGQQQRLCIARAIAVQPDVLLMDEPCSALDPVSTVAIEDLIAQLRREYTVVIVTHNMQQAQRVSDQAAFFNTAGAGLPGRLVEYAPTERLFSEPAEQATADYVAGRFG